METCAASRHGLDLAYSAKLNRSFADRGQANSGTLPCRYAPAIITNFHIQVMVESEVDGAGACLGMTNYVGHSFLHDAVDRDFDGGGKWRERFWRIYSNA